MNLLVVGDSHAKGRLPHGTVDSDAIAVRVGTPEKYRLAVSGSTALQWAADEDGRLSAAQGLASECDAALVSLLGNDLFQAAADGRVELPEIAAAGAAMYEVIRSVAQCCPRVFVLLYGYPYRDRDARKMLALLGLDAAIRSVCECVRATLVTAPRIETLDERALLSRDDWPGDDIHPFESGYLKLADEILRRTAARP